MERRSRAIVEIESASHRTIELRRADTAGATGLTLELGSLAQRMRMDRAQNIRPWSRQDEPARSRYLDSHGLPPEVAGLGFHQAFEGTRPPQRPRSSDTAGRPSARHRATQSAQVPQ